VKVLLLALVIGVVAWGCGGGGSDNGDGAPEPGEGVLIVSSVGQITERSLQSGAETVLATAAAANSFLLDAAPSPDGTRIVYIYQPPAEIVDGRFDAGSDLWVMNRDGSQTRLIFEHAVANQLVRFPRWQDDSHILAIVTELSTVEGVTRVLYTLQRFNVETGERERLREDVLSFDVSPDGTQLVYAEFRDPVGEVLAGSGVDGADEIVVVGQDQQLQPFGYPRFSPDGEEVAFASADQTGASLSPRLVTTSIDGGRAPRDVSRTLLDGLPQDVWTVDAAGGRAVRVADLKEDLPALTWDGSGDRIYVLGVGGLYDISVSTGAVSRIGEGTFHGQIAWAPAVD
jgi:hypothetical protein